MNIIEKIEILDSLPPEGVTFERVGYLSFIRRHPCGCFLVEHFHIARKQDSLTGEKGPEIRYKNKRFGAQLCAKHCNPELLTQKEEKK
jgi:hypothetical protein